MSEPCITKCAGCGSEVVIYPDRTVEPTSLAKIAALLSLAEVVIRYPEDQELADALVRDLGPASAEWLAKHDECVRRAALEQAGVVTAPCGPGPATVVDSGATEPARAEEEK